MIPPFWAGGRVRLAQTGAINHDMKTIENYKAEIYARGAECDKLYGKNLATLKAQAIRNLTHLEPGIGGLYPDRVEIYRKTGSVSGNLSRWALVCTINYSEVSEEHLEWKRRNAEREARKWTL